MLRDYEAECVEHWSCMREEERHRVRLVRRDDLRLRSVVVFVNVPAHGHPCGGRISAAIKIDISQCDLLTYVTALEAF